MDSKVDRGVAGTVAGDARNIVAKGYLWILSNGGRLGHSTTICIGGSESVLTWGIARYVVDASVVN